MRDGEKLKKEEVGNKLVRARQQVSVFVVRLVAHGGRRLIFFVLYRKVMGGF